MAIFTVELADGREVEVEANSPQEAARAAHTYQTNSAQRQGPPTLERRSNAGALPWQQLRSQPQQQARSPMQTARGAVANINRGIPFATDISGAYAGLSQGGGELVHQLQTPQNGPLDSYAIEAAARQGYQQQVEGDRGAQQQFAQDHPNTAPYLEGTGIALSTLPALMTGGASTVAQAPTRAPGLFGRMAQGASVGSMYGYAYGAGGQDQAGNSIEERMNAGNEGGAMGAAFGAAIPPALGVANQAYQRLGRPAWESLVAGARRLPTAAPNTVGALGANMRPPPPAPRRTPPRQPPIPGAVVNYVERNARRERLTPDQLQTEFAGARRNPQGQVLNDVLGDNGVRQLRPIVQSPGETSRRAGEVVADRNAAQSERIINSLRRNLRVTDSRQAAVRRLRADYDRVSAENYRPVFQQTIPPQQRQALERVLTRHADDPVMVRATREAHEIFERQRRLGIVQGQIDDNFARYAHYIKLGLDEAVAAAPIGSRGLQATQMRDVNAMRRQVLDAIDESVPGYREARAQWGGLHAAEEALDEGAKFLTVPSDEVRARVAEMTPFELEHARIGMADALALEVGLRGSTDTTVNIANARLFRAPEMRQRIAALFETPEQAADFLGTLSTQNRLMSNAIGWNGGSSTYANLAHGDDNVAAAAAEGFVDVVRGNVGGAVNRGARQLGNFVFNNAIERQNNIVGEAALRRIDDPEAKAFTDELVRILRERERARLTEAAAGRLGGAGAGSQQGDRR